MKKFLALAFALVLTLALVACGGGSDSKKNGTYTAEVDKAWAAENSRGSQDRLTVEYKDGVIVSATFDSYNVETGLAKSDDDDYAMDYHPREWMRTIEENIVAGGTADKVDVVTGATHTAESAIELLKAIEKDGKPGETIVVTPAE